jgi:hypothetical protein
VGRGRGSLGTAKSRGCSRAAISRFTRALLSASILALIPSILLWSQLTRVEARAATRDVPANTAIVAVTNTPTATDQHTYRDSDQYASAHGDAHGDTSLAVRA